MADFLSYCCWDILCFARILRIFLFLLTASLYVTGCSPKSWIANYHMVTAENAYMKAYEMRTRKDLQNKRPALYRTACEHFAAAYRTDRGVFTLMRIQMAWDACTRTVDSEYQQVFEDFQREYEALHPVETEYGDAFPVLEY
ncbi:MAG: hypothetical protein NC930_00305 [Candidatus Omnitrophica bacterium]|nr:hypothetical protein [Candidatus Omnitrophota bacterium]